MPPVRAALKTLRKSPLYSEAMGTTMTSDAARTAMAIDDANTRQSGAVEAHAPSGSASVTMVKPTHDRAAPKVPATIATISTSTISCCASRCRFAPSAERTANSADRASTCPSIRAATLAQPIKRISAVAASVACSAGRMGPNTSSRTG